MFAIVTASHFKYLLTDNFLSPQPVLTHLIIKVAISMGCYYYSHIIDKEIEAQRI